MFNSVLSQVYTRVLTRVQLTFGCEASSNPPVDEGRANPVYNRVGGVYTGGKSRLIETGLELSCKRAL